MEIAGYIASVFIGLVLGLIGGGGSILTVPVLVYLFSIDAVIATAYSLFIVGLTSAFGALSYYRKGLVNLKTALLFGAPSIVSVYLTRALIIPAIPDTVFSNGNFVVTKSLLILLLFAALMIAASYKMIKPTAALNPDAAAHQLNYPLIIINGILIGFLTGLVGAGGGFLIIPALVLLCKIPMKEAIGTSLTIITANTLIGFLGVPHSVFIDWVFLFKISGLAILGIFLGIAISKKIDGPKLKPIFGWFVLVMGIYIILRETLLK
ncbi:MAG: sulfite exporter TauE/SafE family protein [Ginsengibacter sp.]